MTCFFEGLEFWLRVLVQKSRLPLSLWVEYLYSLASVMLAFRQIMWPITAAVCVVLCVCCGGSIACHTWPWPCTVRGGALAALLQEGIVLRRKCFGPCGRWWVTKYHYICAHRLCWQPNDNIEVCSSSRNEILWPYYLGIRNRENIQSAENGIIYGEGEFLSSVCACTFPSSPVISAHLFFMWACF